MSRLPEGWEKKPLGEITEPSVDQGGPVSNPFTYIDISCVNNLLKRIEEPRQLSLKAAPSRARQRLKTGDVLVSMTRPNLNAVALVPKELDGSVGSTGFHVLRNRDVESKWLFLAVQSSDFVKKMSQLVQGALYPAIRPKDIRKYPLAVPPQPQQRKLVSEIEKHFSRLDAALKSLKRAQVQLKRYRASVLAAACSGRLVPTEAELARNEMRDYEPASELLKRILHERRSRWEADYLAKQKTKPKDDAWKKKYKEPAAPNTSELPELPEGWCWATVDQLAYEVRYGTSFKTREEEDGVPVLGMGHLVDGEIRLRNLKSLPPNHEEFPDLLLQPEDLLFNRTNSAELVGKTAIFHGIPSPCSYASYLIRVRLCAGSSPRLLATYINSPYGRNWVKKVASQVVGQANVNGTKLKELVFPLPPLAEQTRIVAEVERLLSIQTEVQDVIEKKVAHAASLRQSILRHAFTGKLVQ